MFFFKFLRFKELDMFWNSFKSDNPFMDKHPIATKQCSLSEKLYVEHTDTS